MTRILPGFSSASASTEVPLEMLAACHGRIAAQGETLRRLMPHLREHGPDLPAQQAAAAVLRYFDSAARHHHDDEEQDLFPALLESMAGSDAICLREMLDGLTADHRALEAIWRGLRPALDALARGRGNGPDEAPVEAFVAAYERHIEREDTELLPMAARLLDDTALDRIGEAMRLRRGISAV